MLIRNLLDYLEHSAKKYPCKIGYCDEKNSYSFSDTLCCAKKIGTNIACVTKRVNSPVVVLSERTAITVISLFGTLYSGNFYVPLDAKMPIARMKSIMETLSPCAIVIPEHLTEMLYELSDYAPFVIQENCTDVSIDEKLLLTRRSAVLDIDPAYSIFTSGSTGTPKGIVVSHRSIIDFTEWLSDMGRFNENDILGNQAPFHFDLSGKDIYTSVKHGCTMHIIPQKLFMFPKLLLEYLDNNKVTALLWATSAFHLVANSDALSRIQPRYLRIAALGGEALLSKQLSVWRKALPHVKYVNMYGPTEVTVDCTYFPIDRDFADGEAIPIGKACENMEVFLLDEKLNEVKDGEPGEICVRGIGVTKGYFGDEEKTKEVFIRDPRNRSYTDIIYRTGDIAVKGEDGLFRFLSRKDGQIKHMGYRIELGEIETQINAVDEIKSSVCLYDNENKKLICIYTGNIDSFELAKKLRSALPKYMVPNVYHCLEKLPYNSNGKIDRVKLRAEFVK
ncbi:MAG: amino acid adenylation domain-containing protein [Clostridia bacterium]|nr:amino acid adenylation domain-containing protein [Clostridia bacterium]